MYLKRLKIKVPLIVSLFLCLIFVFGIPFSSAFTQFLISPESSEFTLKSLEAKYSNFEISFSATTPETDESQPYVIERNQICNQYDEDWNCIDGPPNLCPYISIQPNGSENTENGFTLNASSPWSSGGGELNYPTDQIDQWTISVASPCFEGECPADYDSYIHGQPLSQSLKGGTFECELNVYWDGGIFPVQNFTKTAYAAPTNKMRVSATLTGENEASPGNSSVLFIPGFMASDLYVQGAFENRLWPPNSFLKTDVEKLMLDSNGNPVTPGIYTKNIIDETFGLNIYKSFIQKMNDLVSDGDIPEWQSFPYDWRKDIQKVVNESTVVKIGDTFENKKLIDEAIALAQRSPTGKITIIGHSNGGLVGKALIKELAGQGKAGIVDQFIMVATPQVGTPKTIGSLLHGDQQALLLGLILDRETARDLGFNMQSAYNLLPTQKYFDLLADPVISFDDSINQLFDYSANGLQKFIHDYDGMTNFITMTNRGSDTGESTNVPATLRSDLTKNANSNVNSLSNWQIPANISVYEIAGWGQSTIKGVNYRSKQHTVCSNANGLYICQPESEWDRKLQMTTNGDGTVVLPSATADGSLNEYFLDLLQFNTSESTNLKHHNILEVPHLLDLLSQILTHSPDSQLGFISSSKPTYLNQNLQFSVHSPVSLSVYDSNGLYTGLASTTPTDAFTFVREEIPNSYYLEIGSDKYVGLDNGKSYLVALNGEGSGTFTLNQEITEGDQILDSKSFIDIPVTPTTKASLNIDSGQLSETINLDVDGNGVTDIQVQAGNEFDPVVYLTVMKSVIKTFDLRKEQEKNLTKKIDNLIKLIQKGKIEKASAKSEIYVNKLNKKLEKISNKPRKGKKITEEEIKVIIQNLEEFIDNLK